MRNQWTRERIIRHLLERQAKGQPLTVGGEGIDTRLYGAARRIFGSWQNALRAAGIAPSRVFTRERWTPARILTIIRRLAQRKRPLTVAQMERRYSNIVSAARRHFGSWSKAIVAAGVDPIRLKRVVAWTQERVIEAILTRALRNETLVGRLIQPRSLVEAGQRFFGGWAAAVTAAGLDPKLTVLPPRRAKQPRPAKAPAPHTTSPHRPRQLWTKELIIAVIQARVRNHQELNARVLAREDRGLYRAGRRHLTSWSNALREAGLDPAEHRLTRGRKSHIAAPKADEQTPRQSQGNGIMRPDRPE